MLSDVHRWRSQWQEPRIMIPKLKFLKDYSLLKNLKLQSSQTSGTQLISVYDLWKCLEEKISKLWASLSKGFPENRISNNGLRRLFESSLKAKCWGYPFIQREIAQRYWVNKLSFPKKFEYQLTYFRILPKEDQTFDFLHKFGQTIRRRQ